VPVVQTLTPTRMTTSATRTACLSIDRDIDPPAGRAVKSPRRVWVS
jgi:hypothetical protein